MLHFMKISVIVTDTVTRHPRSNDMKISVIVTDTVTRHPRSNDMKISVIVTDTVTRHPRINEIYSINYNTMLARNNFSCNSF